MIDFLRERFGLKIHVVGHELPKVANTLGVLGFAGQGVKYPADFEKIASYVDNENPGEFYLPDENFGFQKGSGVHVFGRSAEKGGYVCAAHHEGDPVFVVDFEVAHELGFDSSKFNWEKPQE